MSVFQFVSLGDAAGLAAAESEIGSGLMAVRQIKSKVALREARGKRDHGANSEAERIIGEVIRYYHIWTYNPRFYSLSLYIQVKQIQLQPRLTSTDVAFELTNAREALAAIQTAGALTSQAHSPLSISIITIYGQI
jgi:hypothetical protein